MTVAVEALRAGVVRQSGRGWCWDGYTADPRISAADLWGSWSNGGFVPGLPPGPATDQELLLHWSWTECAGGISMNPLLLLQTPLPHPPPPCSRPLLHFVFSLSPSPSLSLSLWRSLVPSPRPCPFLTSVRKLKRVRTPARSLERRGLGLQVLICEVLFFLFFFSHMLTHGYNSTHTHTRTLT